MARIFGHEGVLGIGPTDFGSGKSLRERPFKRGGHAYNSGVLPIGVKAGEVVNVKAEG
jgi:hypothetical protein